MFKIILTTHSISVTVFFLIYFIKTILLLTNALGALEKFKKYTKVLEMLVSALFLVSGIYLLTQIPEINMLLIIKIIVVFASIPIAIIAYKKSNKILAVLSFLLITGAYGLAEMSRTKKTTISAEITDGKIIYEDACKKCHGDNGALSMEGAADLSKTNLSQEEIVQIILNGKGVMPKTQMQENQAKATAEYILKNIKQ